MFVDIFRHRSIWNGIQALTADGRSPPTIVSINGNFKVTMHGFNVLFNHGFTTVCWVRTMFSLNCRSAITISALAFCDAVLTQSLYLV